MRAPYLTAIPSNMYKRAIEGTQENQADTIGIRMLTGEAICRKECGTAATAFPRVKQQMELLGFKFKRTIVPTERGRARIYFEMTNTEHRPTAEALDTADEQYRVQRTKTTKKKKSRKAARKEILGDPSTNGDLVPAPAPTPRRSIVNVGGSHPGLPDLGEHVTIQFLGLDDTNGVQIGLTSQERKNVTWLVKL